MFEEMTPEGIQADILAKIPDRLDKREGSYLHNLTAGPALELWKFYQAFQKILPMVYVDETSGEYIDKACGAFGMKRKAGTKAKVRLCFCGTPGAVVRKGSLFTSAGGLEFSVGTEVVLGETGNGEADAEAVEEGERYNLPEGAVNKPIISIPGVEGVTGGSAEGGTDPETDEALLSRLRARLQTHAGGGNPQHYLEMARETDGVGDARVFPRWNGPGTVRVLLMGQDKKPVDEAVVQSCSARIEENRVIGADVTVESMKALPVHAEATVLLEPGASAEQVRKDFQSYLEEYCEQAAAKRGGIVFDKASGGGWLVYNRIASALFSIQGVLDYSSLLLNGGVENLEIGEGEIPVAEVVSVSV